MLCDCKYLYLLLPSILSRFLTYVDFLLTKGTVVIPSLYNPTNTNENYYYHRGWNLQALAAYVVGIALPFPGFCGVLGASVSTAASHIMDIAWVTSFVTSFVVYFAICWIWPTQNMKFVRERGYAFEQVAPKSGYCDSGPSKDEKTTRDNVVSSTDLKERVEI